MKNTRKMTNTIFAMLLGLLVIAASNQAFAQGGVWTTTGNMGNVRVTSRAILLLTGKVLVIGGVDSTGEWSATSEEFDPATGSWSPSANSIPNAPVSAFASAGGFCHFRATLLGNGKVLLAGGGCDDSGITTNAASLYDPLTHSWTPASPMNFGRDQFGMVTLTNGNALVFGGCAGGCSGPNILGQYISTVGSSAEIYDFQTNTWTQVASMNSIRGNSPSGVVLSDGRVLVGAGSNGFSTVFSTCEIYDPAANVWTTTGSMPGPVVNDWPMILLPDSRVLSIEPQPSTQPGVNSVGTLSTMTFDPSTGQWVSTGTLLSRQDYGRFSGLQDGLVLLSGGSNGTSVVNTAQIYDPTQDLWSTTSSMASPRSGHTATLLSDGRVLVAGGNDGTSSLSSAEIFTPGLITPTPVTTPSPAATPTATPTPQPSPTPLSTPPPTLPPPQGGAGIIFGFINDADDNALQGVTVTLDGADSSESVTTDEEGYFEFKNLSAGDYTLTCEKEGYQTYTQSISLGNDEIQEIETIVLEEVVKAKISGYVVNIKGDPIENVRIKAKGIKTGYKKTAASDADGFFEFDELDGDTYIIVAKKKGYKRAKQTVRLDDGEETEIEIEMKKTSKRIIKASAL